MAARLLAFWICLFALGAGVACADPAPKAALDAAQAQLRTLEQSAARPDADDETLNRLDGSLGPVSAQVHAAVDPLRGQLKGVDARLLALGTAPGPNGPPEAPAIAKERRSLTAEHMVLDATIKRADLLLVEAEQLGQRLSSRRIDDFSQRLGSKSQSILDPGLWKAVADKLPADVGRWTALSQDEVAAAETKPEPATFVIAALFAVLALGLAFPMRVLLKRAALKLDLVRRASARLKGAEIAAASVLTRSALPVLAAAVLVWGLDWAGLFSPKASQIAWALVRAVGVTATAYALGRTVLAPNRPDHRLLPMPDATASALAAYPLLLGASSALGSLVLHANRVAGVSLEAAVAARALVAAVDLVILGFAAAAAGRALAAERREQAPSEPPIDATAANGRRRGPWALGLFAVWAAILVSAASLMLGYVAFAAFLTQEIAWTALVASVVFVLANLTDALFAELAPDDGVFGRLAASAMGLGPRTLDQLSVLLGGLARLLLWLLGWAAVLLPFGTGADDLLLRLESGVTEFKLGGVTVSPMAIAAAICLFAVGLVLTRMFRRWLETRYLPRTRLDQGLSATVATGVSYAGGLIALLVASAYLGLKLTEVTLLASALTVGVGFGLQSVIQNFVAGMILLAGRPIRVGDWIAVGGHEGDVQRINVRATEIKLFDGSLLIVPNQELVTKPVRNVTWSSARGQVQIAFLVGYEADLDAVAAALLEAMKQTKGVLKEPQPSAVVTEFRDYGAAFQGVAYVSSPRTVQRVRSEILLELSRRLKAAGIRPGVDYRQAIVQAPAHKPDAASLGGRPNA